MFKKETTKTVIKNRPFILTETVGYTATKPLRNKTKSGERVVSENFCSHGSIYKLYNNLYIWNEDKTKVYQIDHVAIGWKNIYVVETKDVYGLPYYGSRTDEYWGIAESPNTVMFDVNFEKAGHWIKNPYQQNQKHLEFIRELCPGIPADRMHSLIVFHADDFRYAPTAYGEPLEEGPTRARIILSKNIHKILDIDDSYEPWAPFTEMEIKSFTNFFDQFIYPDEEIKEKQLALAKKMASTV